MESNRIDRSNMISANEEGSKNGHNILDSYLTIAPSGLERVTIDAINAALSKFSCHVKQLNSHVSEKEILDMKQKVLQQQQKRITIQKKKQRIDLHRVYNEKIFGTCELDDSSATGRKVSIGFHGEESDIVSTPGGLEGKILIQFDTDAPPETVAMIRSMGCGPLMALVVRSPCDGSETKTIDVSDSVDQSIASLSSFLNQLSGGDDDYQNKFSSALNLWSRHAEKVWFRSKDVHEYLQSNRYSCKKQQRSIVDDSNDDVDDVDNNASQHNAIRAEIDLLHKKLDGVRQMKYRVSCIRAFSKDYKYKRDDLIPHLASILIPNVGLASDVSTKKYCVDLDKYDFEVVMLISNGSVYVAIALNYYQYVGAKSFSSGKIPPDISTPYIKGELSKDVIRLRPSIASLLYRLSKVKTGDIVLDPCAGVGTIPVEGLLEKCYALGGDLVLTEPGLEDIAVSYNKAAKNWQKEEDFIGGSDMISWDAALLPIREGSIDVIMTDLPFGVKCMSATKLKSFLPLLFSECARLLRPSGSMTLLCGSFQVVLEALEEIESSDSGPRMFQSPSAIIPVNIGGLSAWIFRITRTTCKVIPLPNKQQRTRKLMKGRLQTMIGAKRRVQA